MQRLLLFSLGGIVLAACILYAADYGLIRFGHNPYGSVIVTRYYVIPKKNGKTEFDFQPAALQPCVHSLFPHVGLAPCWYLSRHPEQAIRL